MIKKKPVSTKKQESDEPFHAPEGFVFISVIQSWDRIKHWWDIKIGMTPDIHDKLCDAFQKEVSKIHNLNYFTQGDTIVFDQIARRLELEIAPELFKVEAPEKPFKTQKQKDEEYLSSLKEFINTHDIDDVFEHPEKYL